MKALESKIHSCVGADGAIFAIRKNLYRELNEYDINDFVIPLQIIKGGHRGVLSEKSCCYEMGSKSLHNEFNRQVRIMARTILSIKNNLSLCNPKKYPMFSFFLISHKIMKLIAPYLQILIFLTNGLIVFWGQHHNIYFYTFMLQIILYMSCLMNSSVRLPKTLKSVLEPFCSFTIINIAIIKAWYKNFRKVKFNMWETER
jgi:hypothetical protein